MRKIGVLGASFNPPTFGHKSVILQALTYFDELLLVPSLKHPFNKPLAPFLQRLLMIQIFIDCLPETARKKVQLFNVEGMLLSDKSRKYIYTFDVLQKLQRYYEIIGELVQLRFVIGPDNAKNSTWKKFYQYQEIDKRWPPFVVKEDVKTHSEQVRAGIKKFKSNPVQLRKVLAPMLDEAMIHYIIRNKLYVE